MSLETVYVYKAGFCLFTFVIYTNRFRWLVLIRIITYINFNIQLMVLLVSFNRLCACSMCLNTFNISVREYYIIRVSTEARFLAPEKRTSITHTFSFNTFKRNPYLHINCRLLLYITRNQCWLSNVFSSKKDAAVSPNIISTITKRYTKIHQSFVKCLVI